MRYYLFEVSKNVLIGIIVVGLCYIGGCNYSKIDIIKRNSTLAWNRAGYNIVGYEGLQIGMPWAPGGQVWYTVNRTNQPDIIYHGFIGWWYTGEYQVWNVSAINAISSK